MSQISELLKSEAFYQGVESLLLGTVDRKTLAAELGVSTSTLSTAFKRAGLTEKLKATKASGRNEASRSNLVDSRLSPDRSKAYEDAIAYVLAGHTAVEAHAKFPTTSYQSLARKVRERRVGLNSPQRDVSPVSSLGSTATSSRVAPTDR